jgi:hypothetical protein
MKLNYLGLLVLILLSSCDNNEDCCLPITDGELLGTYRVYEYGYSPGDRYITEEVPASPAQLLYFYDDNRFSSNYAELKDFTYYLLLKDDREGTILALFTEEPDLTEEFDINNLSHSYSVEFDVLSIRLNYRFCIEGCHIGLKKIEELKD